MIKWVNGERSLYLQFSFNSFYDAELVISDYDICSFSILHVFSMYRKLTSHYDNGKINEKSSFCVIDKIKIFHYQYY